MIEGSLELPFLFMKQVIFEYVEWPYTSATVYTILNDPKLKPSKPTVIKLIDWFSLACVPYEDTQVAGTGYSLMSILIKDPKYIVVDTDDKQDKSTTGSISESTLLKAIAITKDVSLATQLIKD